MKPKTKKIPPKVEKILKLNPNQEFFCKLYASDREFFGNGTASYIEAYDTDTSKPGHRSVAAAGASDLLRKPYICDRIRELLNLGGFSDEGMDKELLFVAKQYDDLSSKVAAIREYNKLKKRTEDKTVINANFSLSKLFEESPANKK